MVFTICVRDFKISGKTATIESEFTTFHNVILTEQSNLESGEATLRVIVNKRGQLSVLCIN